MAKTLTNTALIKECLTLAKKHFGKDEVKFIALRYKENKGWFIKLKMRSSCSCVFHGKTDTKAIKKLKSYLKSTPL